MGHMWSAYVMERGVSPNYEEPPTFDPLYGFPNGRKERVMIATRAEMEAAKIPLDQRDYCAHKLLEFMACRKEAMPFPTQCAHEKHMYATCLYEDHIIRMKEYERERRLLKRQKRKSGVDKELLA